MLYLFAVSFSNPFAFVTSCKFIYKKKKPLTRFKKSIMLNVEEVLEKAAL